ncbi:AAA family ATPase [Pseudomonas syringae]|uniref:AAA family ATPase n=1 Tax=Pseudomonas syringae TaxID=317 RepID=UPI000A1FC6EB|nr:ATP-binding protein [Pseudomonas syringae]MDU8268782.1 AAA family ATPase [Pseudomonas syringae pv. actinidiae]MDU8284477.1 AAA family ATPase [Pseudomonas syringae pv. actinidiae]MDU8306071.1 AAA family ATPase [Pseudomonas syringae pv. actinidiae]OSN30917.1 DNA replication and repair protein RecF [Pseudomonas syringae pv. actinidiae]OSN41211.1 DNA replication and repair protein RecF [Pseudomonas syringae pv. actinidiae]
MLISIELKNFKSYESASLPLAAMTFLIGTNASGKSNVLEAIRLLNWLAKGSRLEDITRSIQSGDAVVRGQANDLLRDPLTSFSLGGRFEGVPQGWGHFEISIGLVADQLVVTAESVVKPGEAVPLYQVDGLANAHTDEIRVAYNNFKRGKNKPHIPCSNRQAIFYQLETPGRFESGHNDSQRVIPAVTKAIRETLRNVVFLDPRPAMMRDYAYVKDDLIKEDGSNLSAVLYRISQVPEQKARLLAFIKSLPEQDITDIEFIKTDRNDVMVRLVESFGHKSRTVDAPLLSDGTLRVLAVGATLLTAPEGALVVIEEIDNGVHPSRAETLVRQLRATAAERKLRVLLTSHNPALMDALPDSALADVVACYRDPEHGDSRLVRLGDLDRYPELVAQGPLGQLMTRRVLDRFLKDDTTEDERKAHALDWLAELRRSTDGGAE